ncbi:mandelate racemase/muconate lactonizing protein [Arthrobacter crystallopoietes BAB-32]|uniref:Mandelate racemase/muconate lactonizing protein n=1 Tax=Arthrobacter crystallopoietes BAB-32 TaxID=1246476 RepID=N1V875_9MICC|nr:mandelate racemase/muconate lactonizing enzyme family protein [Arthrobacter crystallopoietes]EMY36209.1 mandelate racemase/muconate lactonizing protein [Arthrobacter crystallopoietes BAB-32]
MKIVAVDCFGYNLRYAHGEYVMSGNRAATSEIGTLVRLRTDEGLEGWGEVTPLGNRYLPTHWAEIRAALHTLARDLIGEDPTNLSAIRRTMDNTLLGGEFAKSPIDMACWDLLGKQAGLPVAALLGGVLQEDFPLYEAVPLASPEEMAEFVTRRGEAGIKRFQLKVGNDPHDDVRRTRATVEAAQEGTIIVADSNGGWNLRAAQIAVKEMEDLPVFIEQPCRDTDDCIFAMRHSTLPLVLDESILNNKDVFRAKYDAGAVSINIKISRVGGLTKAARMRDLMQELDMMISMEDTWGGDIVSAAVSHLAASTKPENFQNASFMNDWTDGHVAGYNPRSVGGRGSAPKEPGLGITVQTQGLEPIFSVS